LKRMEAEFVLIAGLAGVCKITSSRCRQHKNLAQTRGLVDENGAHYTNQENHVGESFKSPFISKQPDAGCSRLQRQPAGLDRSHGCHGITDLSRSPPEVSRIQKVKNKEQHTQGKQPG